MTAISTDNEVIYFLLEKADRMFSDYSADQVIAFDQEDDFCLVIYIAADRNFILFTAENYLQEINAFPILLETIQQYPGSLISENIIDTAIKIVENKMHSKNNSRFYFDAH